MLKGIDPIITPDLLAVIARMGHGDVLAVVDRNFPAYAGEAPVVPVSGAGTTRVAEALFSLFPVDTFIDEPIGRMMPVDAPGDVPDVQTEFVAAAESAEGRRIGVEGIERFDFYDRARLAFATVHTSEDRPYGCFLVTKGVV